MVPRNNIIWSSDSAASQFSHKITALCALNVNRNVTISKSQLLQLQPCRKQHVSMSSQTPEYQSRLLGQSSVSFDTTTPPQHRWLQLRKALHVQNTAIDSYQVAVEVHKQHKVRDVAVDSGASSNFYCSDYIGEKYNTTAAPIRVGCANKEVMNSLATDIIKFNNLPIAAKKCHKFKKIWLPLLFIP